MKKPWMKERNREVMQFMREYGGAAIQYAHGLAGNSHDAKELVQEALCRVLSSWHGSDVERPIKPWFFTILRNRFVDSYREGKRRSEFASESRRGRNGNGVRWGCPIVRDNGAFLEELARKETADRVRGAINEIRPKLRVTVFLRDIEGDAYVEIARKLRVPLGTVRSRVHRARRALRRRLEEMETEA